MSLPNLRFAGTLPGPAPEGVTFAVYAPFGTDPVLSRYPNDVPQPVTEHPLVTNLMAVAARGVHVSALIDLHDDVTWLLEIDAGKPTERVLTSCWKQQMDAPRTLAGFLLRTRARRPGTALVLALEGHGAGYLPDLDRSQLTPDRIAATTASSWEVDAEGGAPVLPMGSPLLPMGSPLLPMGSPLLPSNHAPLSTWGLGEGLRLGLEGASHPIGVVHLNNCFNLSLELLHTIAPHAQFAAGYPNYNFFSAGAGYPAVFEQLQAAGVATTQLLARWFSEGNHEVLLGKTHHPTCGGVVRLASLATVAQDLDRLARALIKPLTETPASERPRVVDAVRTALRTAQQYDSVAPQSLDTPDEVTDLMSLAVKLRDFPFNGDAVRSAAQRLQRDLIGVKVYGDRGTPWTSPEVEWDFGAAALAINVFCPDPLLEGRWDWRSPFYLDPDADTRPQPVQPHVIPLLKQNAWVPFLIEYHRAERFVGLRHARIPEYPIFNRKHGLP